MMDRGAATSGKEMKPNGVVVDYHLRPGSLG